MNKPTVRIHNIETNEVIDREMSDTEFAEYKKDQAETAAAKAEAKAKAEARAAKKEEILDRLGLTDEEIKLLLG
jgi:hypothetical protein